MSFEAYISNILSEHFKSYIILAYDYEDRHFVGHKLNSQKDFDSFVTAMARQQDQLEDCVFPVFEEEDDEDDI